MYDSAHTTHRPQTTHRQHSNSRSISRDRHRHRDRKHDLDHDRDFEQKRSTPFADHDQAGPVAVAGSGASSAAPYNAHRSSHRGQAPRVNTSKSSVSGAFAQHDTNSDEVDTSDDEVAPMVAWHEVSALLAKANTDGVQATFLMQSDGSLLASAVTRPLTESNLKEATNNGDPDGGESKLPFDDVASSTASSLTSAPFTTLMPGSRPVGGSGSVYGGPPYDYSSRRDSAATIPPLQPHSYGTNASVMDFRDVRPPAFSVDRSQRRAQEQEQERPPKQRTRETDRELRGTVAQLWHIYKVAAAHAFGGEHLTSLIFEQPHGIVYAHNVDPYLLLMYASKDTPLGLMRVKAEELALILNMTLVAVYNEAAAAGDENAHDQGADIL